MILQPREKTKEALVFVLTSFGGWIESKSDLQLPAQGQTYVSDILIFMIFISLTRNKLKARSLKVISIY